MNSKNRTVLGVDPGDRHSALVEWDGEKILHATKIENKDALFVLMNSSAADVVIENIIPFGRFVGKNVTETACWIGRLQQAAEFSGKNTHLLYRKAIVAHMTGLAKNGDAKVRAALIERFGCPPSKGKPNEVYNGCKVTGDCWQAWAVAVTWWDKHCGGMI